jgi:tRNA A37 threonylcarbamoyladenosine dehydratase
MSVEKAVEAVDSERFGGIVRLYGERNARAFTDAHVAVVGIGGVGSWAAEALARSGVGAITLIDLDDVCVTNTNRQIHAVTSTVGQSKVHVMADRLRDISPSAEVTVVKDFVDSTNAEQAIHEQFDVVLDAIDSFRDKLSLIVRCANAGVPLVVAGAAGGRLDPTQLRVDDLNETMFDPLLRKIRKALRQSGAIGGRKESWGVPTVYSAEQARFPTKNGGTTFEKPGSSGMIDCDSGMGTVTHVTGSFGFHLAHEALKLLAVEPLD